MLRAPGDKPCSWGPSPGSAAPLQPPLGPEAPLGVGQGEPPQQATRLSTSWFFILRKERLSLWLQGYDKQMKNVCTNASERTAANWCNLLLLSDPGALPTLNQSDTGYPTPSLRGLCLPLCRPALPSGSPEHSPTSQSSPEGLVRAKVATPPDQREAQAAVTSPGCTHLGRARSVGGAGVKLG